MTECYYDDPSNDEFVDRIYEQLLEYNPSH